MKTQRVFSVLVLAISFIFAGFECHAQDTASSKPMSFGLGYYRYVSGSGHGTGNVPVLLLERGKSRLLLGPNFQNVHSAHLSGAYAGYEYTFTVGDYGEELFVNSNVIYHQSAYLSKKFVAAENKLHSPYGSNAYSEEFKNLKFRTVEYYIGLGLRKEIEENFKFSAAIDVGGYSTLWKSDPKIKLYFRNPSDICLMLQAGLTYQF